MTWAVTGTSMICSVGMTKEACFRAFCDGVAGNRPLQAFDRDRFTARCAYEIPDRIPDRSDVPARATRWLCAAINAAVQEAGLLAGHDRLAFLVGTGLRELRSLELWWADGHPFQIEALHFGGAVQRATGFGCPVMTFSNACAASNFALGLATDLLALDEADVVVVAGCDSITESMFGLLDRVNPLHPECLQPFDAHRRGVVMGEGAAALVLETADHASARDARARAWVRGVGMNCDAYHETAPAQEGIAQAMIDAHRRAGVRPEEIDVLLAHGTGTMLNDTTEALAIREVFGQAGGPAISGLKSMTGHTSGASGLIGVVTAIECLNQGRIPPTLGLTEALEEARGFDIIVEVARSASPRLAQVNAFGFGGVNAVVILERSI